jgi:hypothetical protein
MLLCCAVLCCAVLCRRALASLAAAAEAAGHPEWGYAGPHDSGGYNSLPLDTDFFKPHGGSWDTGESTLGAAATTHQRPGLTVVGSTLAADVLGAQRGPPGMTSVVLRVLLQVLCTCFP